MPIGKVWIYRLLFVILFVWHGGSLESWGRNLQFWETLLPRMDQSNTTGKYCLGCISLPHHKRLAFVNIVQHVDVGQHVLIYGCLRRRTYLLENGINPLEMPYFNVIIHEHIISLRYCQILPFLMHMHITSYLNSSRVVIPKNLHIYGT